MFNSLPSSDTMHKKTLFKGASDAVQRNTHFAQEELDCVFLDARKDWFKSNRPKEHSLDGYVTTPGQSEIDLSRPSARHYARKTNRVFDSVMQAFRKLSSWDIKQLTKIDDHRKI